MTTYLRRAKDGIWNDSIKLGNSFCYTAAALLLPSLSFAFTPTYTLTDLGVLPGTTEAISGEINIQGDAIGTALATNDHGILFHRGKVIDLVPTAVRSFANGINSSSKITGVTADGLSWQGFVYVSGAVTPFKVPGSMQTWADSVNDFGAIAGFFSPAGIPIDTHDHIFVRQPNGAFTDLGDFGAFPSALAINDQGRVLIGTVDDVALTGSTFISRPGSKNMEKVPPLVPGGIVEPSDMNQFGEVVGVAYIDTLAQHGHAYVYFNGKTKDLGTLQGSSDSRADGINNLGQIVGGGASKSGVGHGWVDVDSKLRDLNGLLNSSGKGWVIDEARSINDLGRVLADAHVNGGRPHVVELIPNCVLPNLAP